MYNLVGFVSILLLILITLIIGIRWPAVSRVLLVALALRLLFLIINNHIFYLPDGDMDAKNFEQFAWERSQDDFLKNFNMFRPDSYFYSSLLAIPYSLFGRSVLLAQSLSILFGIGSVFLGWLVAKKLWDKSIAIKVAWSIALFPTLISYSVLTMREVYITFFLLLAIYGIVNWFKLNNFKSIFFVLLGFIAATFFHGALIIGLFVFLFIVMLDSFKIAYKSLKKYRINPRIILLIIISSIILGLFLTNKIKLPYIQTFEKSINPSFLRNTIINLKVKGEAAYPEWTKVDSNIELIYKIPLRSVYFIFSPFPWDVKKPSHLLGVLDSFLYMILVYLIFRNIKVIWNDPALRIILIILISYIIIFGVGVSNFGSGIRHRSKFVIEFILLAAPLIPRFIIFKKKN